MVTVKIVCNKPLKISNERWIRIPKQGYCDWCGLSRSHLFALIAECKVRSVSLKKPGNVRGVRLVWLPSIFEYIEQEGDLCEPDPTSGELQKYMIDLDGLE